MSHRIAFWSLGCKLNQYEIQALREGFLRHGYKEVPPKETADYYVLNTCTVTESADKEALQIIRACRQRNPESQIIVTGCSATADASPFRNLPGITHVFDNRSKNRILSRITGVPETSGEESPFFDEGISYFENHSRAFVKVQDGCNYFCTFCKIPYVRGRLVSRDETRILEEVRRLLDHGYQEIVLSGVCLGSYGKDGGGPGRLPSLIRNIIAIPGDFRIRLSSIDPRDTPLELAEIMADSEKLCPHLHLSLQSGDDKILSRMKRGYTTAQIEYLVENIRRLVPQIGFSTDVIVGFPGEDEKSFEITKRFLEKIAFHKVHLFPYSERAGTKAAAMNPKIPRDVIRRRAQLLGKCLKTVTHEYLVKFIGNELRVLVDEKSARESYLSGFSENYIRCYFEGNSNLKGTLQRVRILESSNDRLFARLQPKINS